MAWRCTGATNAELIANMAKAEIIHSDRVTASMTKVDRANYVRYANGAYEDSPQTIGYGATISAPHMHAHAVEHLLPFLKPGSRVLDVGSGSGYLTAVLYQLLQDPSDPRSNDSKVVGIEHVSELVEWSVGNLRKDGLGSALDAGQIKVIAGDGRKGLPEDGPYDAIHVGAAAPTLPKELIEQLARPGRMFIPVGTQTQQVLQIDKDVDGNVTSKPLFDVLYVPLTDRDKQS
ncbi:Pcmt1-prov protein [Trametes versicolor FP-101664 SS1]|uniref:Pcmt1-prov protein n=1 Tax=Trametes versicolor (strain FP-101664) TaxID=717944 RepID=UPI0004622903|nr:Pcmt1-prov protein [Trametes versicolor FP-101664 SS1]EIW54993.1 Pcmt1-prov protein [Trametes versicolor FP-101664 SS1]